MQWTTDSRSAQEKRYDTIKHIYILVLKHGWHISTFHDKFLDPRWQCFLLVSSEKPIQKEVVRIRL